MSPEELRQQIAEPVNAEIRCDRCGREVSLVSAIGKVDIVTLSVGGPQCGGTFRSVEGDKA